MHTRTKVHSMTVTGSTGCDMEWLESDSYYICKNDSYHRPNWTLEQLITLNRHLLQFTNLTSLTFGSIGIFTSQIIPGAICQTLRFLPSLKKLSFIRCVVEQGTIADSLDSSGPQWPQLTELTMWSSAFEGSQSPFFDLMRANTLRVLRLEWIPPVLNSLSSASMPPETDPAYEQIYSMLVLPSSLCYLQARLPFASPDSDDPVNWLILLAKLVASCKRLVGLTLRGYDSRTRNRGIVNHFTGSWSFIREYSGTSVFLPFLAGPESQLETMEIGRHLRFFPESSEYSYATMRFPKLRSLSLKLYELDSSVFYELARARLDEVEKLTITYKCWKREDFKDDALRSLGAQFLSEMPRLAILHLYSTGEDHSDPITDVKKQCSVHLPNGTLSSDLQSILEPRSSLSGEVNVQKMSTLCECDCTMSRKALEFEYIASWRIYCPRLGEIRLSEGFIWKKDRAGYDDERLEDCWWRSQLES
ncbi:hypothetical protein K435DRAFT_857171 [Dendrothele bispora CBS 962.96]|uniref:F-box domain-containing protein n=1 Tax=Dendrothele bispora (strain CBS 962.96) TaxID=1314807 RepID=A0A4S8M7Y6_DENBC|nr:hypothetical protein K435DRAFT_857171 [Dendrothele bispora CBS 962.96]